jgi:hypothetical protein
MCEIVRDDSDERTRIVGLIVGHGHQRVGTILRCVHRYSQASILLKGVVVGVEYVNFPSCSCAAVRTTVHRIWSPRPGNCARRASQSTRVCSFIAFLSSLRITTELCAVKRRPWHTHSLIIHDVNRKPSPRAPCVSLLILNKITLRLIVICGTVKLGVLR